MKLNLKLFLILNLIAQVSFGQSTKKPSAAKVFKPIAGLESNQNTGTPNKSVNSNLPENLKSDLQIFAKVKDGKIMLRWLPMSEKIWAQGIEGGYVIERNSAILGQSEINVSSEIMSPDLGTIDTTKEQNLALLTIAKYRAERNSISAEELKNAYLGFLLGTIYDYPSAKTARYTYDDPITDLNQKYIYKISLANNPAISSTLEIDPKKITKYANINDLQGKMIKKTVDLTWNENRLNNDYAYFNIEKSVNDGPFTKINGKPYIKTTDDTTGIVKFGETINEPGLICKYRIIGVDMFGENSDPSNVITVATIPDNMPLSSEIRASMESNQTVKLTWAFPVEMEKYIKNFSISQSEDPLEGYQTVLDNITKTSRSATFKANGDAIYLRVNYTDIQDEIQYSYPMLVQWIDTIPPLAPAGLRGNITKDGLLTLEWDKNTEKDLKGYFVYAANDSISEPTKISDEILFTNKYTDSVAVKNVLNKAMYYYLTAIDKRGNYSDYSKVSKVARPDLVAPSKPNFIDYSVLEKNISINWVNSTDNDVKTNTLRRKKEGETTWMTLIQFANNISSFTDTTILPKTKYTYDLTVEDYAGNSSQAYTPLTIESADELIRINFTEFKAEYDLEKEQINLFWTTDRPELIKEFVILREYGQETLSTWRVIDGTENSYLDEQIHKDQTHIYVIQAKLKEGYTSPSSKTVSIKL